MKTRSLSMAIILASAALTSLFSTAAYAQLGARKTGDYRVKELLDRVGLKYEVDGDGDFKLIFRFEETGRTHVVFINSRTLMLGDLEVRMVWAPAITSESMFDAELLSNLLQENGRTKIGSWKVVQTKQGYLAAFGAEIGASADTQALDTIVRAVCLTADLKEQEVTGEDVN